MPFRTYLSHAGRVRNYYPSMVNRKPSVPPRPIAPGDVVVAYSAALGEWGAAQITELDPETRRVGLIQLDWSGPEPSSLADLGDPEPLCGDVYGYDRSPEWNHWVLPRYFTVLGSRPVRDVRPASRQAGRWTVGYQLARRRRAADDPQTPYIPMVRLGGAQLNQILAEPAAPDEDRTWLIVAGIEQLDCYALTDRFPRLRGLHLTGSPGVLDGAASLNKLSELDELWLEDLFGMEKSDCVHPRMVQELDWLRLSSIPSGYATAMRRVWEPEQANGTRVDIERARGADWIHVSMTFPLRHWRRRHVHMTSEQYERAQSVYRTTRQAVRKALAEKAGRWRLVEIGREYGEKFTQVDRMRRCFGPADREDLMAALDQIVDEVGQGDLAWAREALAAGAEFTRKW